MFPDDPYIPGRPASEGQPAVPATPDRRQDLRLLPIRRSVKKIGKSSFLECLILEPTGGRNDEYRRFGYFGIGDFGTTWWWANVANPIGASRSGARQDMITLI